MQLLDIAIVDYDITEQLMIIYSEYGIQLQKKWEHKEAVCQSITDFKIAMIQLGERFGIIFSLSLVHPSNHWVNKISNADRQKSVW